MSRELAVATLLATLLVLPTDVAGQSDEPTYEGLEAELIEAIEAGMPEFERARIRARHAEARRDSIRRERDHTPFDTVMVGPLEVLALPDDGDEAALWYGRVWDEYEPWVGDAASFESTTFTFQFRHFRQGMPVEDDPGRAYLGRAEVRRAWGEERLLGNIRVAIGAWLRHDFPAPVLRWMGNAALVTHPPDKEWERMARELLLTESPATDGCVLARADDCLAALGLSSDDDPVDDWYTSEQLARLLRGVSPLRGWSECGHAAGPEAPSSVARSGSSDRVVPARAGRAATPEECRRRILSRPEVWDQAIPLHRQTRASLVSFALLRGGEGALERFLADWPDWPRGVRRARWPTLPEFSAELRRHLEAASGMTMEELVTAWRERVMEARPHREEGAAERTRFSSFLWILLFAALATRSTRWRLG